MKTVNPSNAVNRPRSSRQHNTMMTKTTTMTIRARIRDTILFSVIDIADDAIFSIVSPKYLYIILHKTTTNAIISSTNKGIARSKSIAKAAMEYTIQRNRRIHSPYLPQNSRKATLYLDSPDLSGSSAFDAWCVF